MCIHYSWLIKYSSYERNTHTLAPAGQIMSAFGIRKKEMFLRLHSYASDESYIQTNDYDSRLVHELDLPGPGLVAIWTLLVVRKSLSEL